MTNTNPSGTERDTTEPVQTVWTAPLTRALTGGAGTRPPLGFFGDEIKTAARSAAVLGIPFL